MMSGRQGEDDAGVVQDYVEEPTTKPTNSAFDCDSVLEAQVEPAGEKKYP
jgi:hypothetical protein